MWAYMIRVSGASKTEIPGSKKQKGGPVSYFSLTYYGDSSKNVLLIGLPAVETSTHINEQYYTYYTKELSLYANRSFGLFHRTMDISETHNFRCSFRSAQYNVFLIDIIP
jgi:hypothetical protein